MRRLTHNTQTNHAPASTNMKNKIIDRLTSHNIWQKTVKATIVPVNQTL